MKKQFVCILTGLLLVGCDGDVKESLGLKREAPDEFRVVSRPPLSVPPDFRLRPPSSSPGVGGKSATSEAAGLVLGEQGARQTQSLEELQQQGTADTAVGVVTEGELETPGEARFMKNAGAGKADPKIRDKIFEETMVQPKEEESFIDRLIPGKDDKKEKQPVVDAAGEKERIEKNQEAGKPVTEGDTPVVEKKKGGILNEVFGN